MDEVRDRRLPEIDKVEREVTARLKREINYWDHRAEDLKAKERAGKQTRLSAGQASEARANELVGSSAAAPFRACPRTRNHGLASAGPRRCRRRPWRTVCEMRSPDWYPAIIGFARSHGRGTRAEVERLAMEAVTAAAEHASLATNLAT